jgi:predicted Rossmann fold flavoprotein
VADTLAWFGSLGLVTRTEADSGRIYPLSDSAGSVVDVLRLALEARGVETRCGCTVSAIASVDEGFLITDDQGLRQECTKVIVSCGGMAGARLGGVKDGYTLLGSLGHRRTGLYPALVQLKTDNTYTRSLKGVRTQAILTLKQGSQILAQAQGEVQFADYGITGPGVFDLSRAAAIAGEGATIVLRLLPELTEDALLQYMYDKMAQFPSYHAENLFSGLLHNAIARVLLRRACIPQDRPLYRLREPDVRALLAQILRFTLPLIGTLGFEDAQVTAGGIATDGFDPQTLESRLVPGLYACGEVLDIDGDCGGYNLQWAWASGRLAGLTLS